MVAGIHLDHRLLGVLAPPLGRDIGGGTFQNFEQCLLDAFARHVATDRWRGALAGYFVDFVEVEDAFFGAGHVVIGRLQKAHEDVLHVLTHVAGLGENGGVGNGEGDLQEFGERFGQFGLASASGADEHYIAFFELHLV